MRVHEHVSFREPFHDGVIELVIVVVIGVVGVNGISGELEVDLMPACRNACSSLPAQVRGW